MFHSKILEDSLKVQVSLPKDYDPKQSYPIIYSMDGAYYLGGKTYMECRALMDKQEIPACIYISVGHRAKQFKKARPRDYIIGNRWSADSLALLNKNRHYGQGERFHRFLREEFLPAMEKDFQTPVTRVYVGHSFSGVFGFYDLFHPKRIFDRHICLAPSLWVNFFNIYQWEAKSRTRAKELSMLYFAAGKGEWNNLILPGTRRMKRYLEKNPYPGLEWKYKEFRGGHVKMLEHSVRNGIVWALMEYK